MLGRRAVWWMIRGYQLTLSSLMGRQCRFEPSCSHYAQEAVMRFGVVRGGWMGLKRIVRCGPWGGSGYDPVSEPKRGEAVTSGKEGHCGCGHHH